uniref:Uncharacterized protein n=1 Tax=Arundo donax TaxID=35708 RepID=A0A0A9AV84_ARUDO
MNGSRRILELAIFICKNGSDSATSQSLSAVPFSLLASYNCT